MALRLKWPKWRPTHRQIFFGLLLGLIIAAVVAGLLYYEYAPLGLPPTTYYVSGGQAGGNYAHFACDIRETLGEAYEPVRFVVEPSEGTVQSFLRLTRSRVGALTVERRQITERGCDPCGAVTANSEDGSHAPIPDPNVLYADIALIQDTPSLTVQAAKRLLNRSDASKALSVDDIRPDALSVENIRALALVDRAYLHVVVRKEGGPKSIADLRGKRVYIGAQGSGTRTVAEKVCLQYGLAEPNDVPDKYEPSYHFTPVGDDWSFDEAAHNLIHNPIEVDAGFFLLPVGSGALSRFAKSGGFTLLDIDRSKQICANEPELEPRVIPWSVCPGTEPFPARDLNRSAGDGVPTVGVRNVLACRADLADPAAYAIVSALFQDPDNSVAVWAIDQLGQENEKNRAAPRLFIPLHRGARFFYERHRYDEWLTIPVLLAVMALLLRLLAWLYTQIQRENVRGLAREPRTLSDKIEDTLSDTIEDGEAQISRRDYDDLLKEIKLERRTLAALLRDGKISDDIYHAAKEWIDAVRDYVESFEPQDSAGVAPSARRGRRPAGSPKPLRSSNGSTRDSGVDSAADVGPVGG